MNMAVSELTWVYFCIQATNVAGANAMRLMDSIAPQAYRLFNLADVKDAEPHLIVGVSRTTALIIVGLRINIHSCKDIITASVVANWQQAVSATIISDDFLEVRQSYDGFMKEVLLWVCRAARSLQAVAERGWPHFD